MDVIKIYIYRTQNIFAIMLVKQLATVLIPPVIVVVLSAALPLSRLAASNSTFAHYSLSFA